MEREGALYVIGAPAGAGKTTLMLEAIKKHNKPSGRTVFYIE
jgi:guanylate kinase